MWDERYAQDGFAYGTEPNDFLRAQFTRIPPGGKVLCLADGEGRNGVFLAQQGFDVTSVDLSVVGLQKAQRLASERGVSLTTAQADLTQFDPGSNYWDGVISIFAHLPAEPRGHLHRRLVRSLKPHGVFILEAYTPAQLATSGVGGPPAQQAEMLMTLNALKFELSGLDFVIGHETVREIQEGQYHHGESAVVQVVATK